MTVPAEAKKWDQVIIASATAAVNTGIYATNKTWLSVTRTRAGVDTVLSVDTDYTVGSLGVSGGCVLTMVGQAASDIITTVLSVPSGQFSTYPTGATIDETEIEADIDELELKIQQVDEKYERAFKLPVTATQAQRDAATIDTSSTVGYTFQITAANTADFAAPVSFGGTEKVYSSVGAMKAAIGLTVGARAVVLGEAEVFQLTNESVGVVTSTIGTEIASDISGVYWKRLYSGPINPIWFGAVSTTDALISGGVATDSAAAINAALLVGSIHFTAGSYLVSSSITVPSNRVVSGDGVGAVTITSDDDFETFKNADPTVGNTNMEFYGFTLNTTFTYGAAFSTPLPNPVGIRMNGETSLGEKAISDIRIHDIHFKNLRIGISLFNIDVDNIKRVGDVLITNITGRNLYAALAQLDGKDIVVENFSMEVDADKTSFDCFDIHQGSNVHISNGWCRGCDEYGLLSRTFTQGVTNDVFVSNFLIDGGRGVLISTEGNSSVFTANAGTDTFTWVSKNVGAKTTEHDLLDGQVVQFVNSGGALPAGLSVLTDYYVINKTTTTVKVSATSGGAAVNITNAGTGTHYIQRQNTVSGFHFKNLKIKEGRFWVSPQTGGKVEHVYGDVTIEDNNLSNRAAYFRNMQYGDVTARIYNPTGNDTEAFELDNADDLTLRPTGVLPTTSGVPNLWVKSTCLRLKIIAPNLSNGGYGILANGGNDCQVIGGTCRGAANTSGSLRRDATPSVSAAGTGYSDNTGVSVTGGSGSGLTLDTTQSGGGIASVVINAIGSGYAASDVITITGGGANATITLAADDLVEGDGIEITNGDIWLVDGVNLNDNDGYALQTLGSTNHGRYTNLRTQGNNGSNVDFVDTILTVGQFYARETYSLKATNRGSPFNVMAGVEFQVVDPEIVVFTATNATNTFNAVAHTFLNGDRVQLTTTGTLPTGSALATDYWVINKAANTYQLSATYGGGALAISNDGSGVHTATQIGEIDTLPATHIGDHVTLYFSSENDLRSSATIALDSSPTTFAAGDVARLLNYNGTNWRLIE